MKKFTIIYSIASTIAIIILAIEIYDLKNTQIITTRGIIVQDSLGRDRILIGAPFPFSKYRVRTDTSLVKKYWASRWNEPEYMNWYKSYNNSGNGMVLLNESGFDKVLVGDDLPDPNTGQRNGIPTGILWNDDEGFERGGLGLNRLKSNNKYRNFIGFDDETGEALHIGILDDGSKMIRFAWSDSVFLIGRGTRNNFLFNTPEPFVGVQFKSVHDTTGYQENLIGKRKK